MYYDVLRIFASTDTFERGQKKLRMAENISDVNTEDEENMKETRHDRAAVKNSTFEDEFSDIELVYCLFYQIRRDFLDHKNYFIRISLHGFWQPISIRLFHLRKTSKQLDIKELV